MDDMKKIKKLVLAAGFTVKNTPGNHYKVYQDGQLAFILPRNNTDRRGFTNLKVKLRKFGIAV